MRITPHGAENYYPILVSFYLIVFASAEPFGFRRASPACGGLGQPRLGSGSPRGELSAMSGVGP